MDKTALFKIGYGLFAITAKDGEKDNGCIINTFMQVTSDPVTAVFALNKANYTHDMILKTGKCNISMLTVDAPFSVYEGLGMASGRDTDKLAGINGLKRAENGILYLTENVNAYLSLEVIGTEDMGAHTLFKARVVEAENLSKAESVTYAYYHANVKPKPQPTKKAGYRCKICGYVYEGEELPADYICPLCKHPAEDFEKI